MVSKLVTETVNMFEHLSQSQKKSLGHISSMVVDAYKDKFLFIGFQYGRLYAYDISEL